MKDVLALRRKRAELIAQARQVLDLAETEKRDLSAEEEGKYNVIMEDVVKLDKEVETEERQQKLEKSLSEPINEPIKPTPEGNTEVGTRASDEYRKAFRNYLQTGRETEIRALAADSDTTGGYLIAPQLFIANLIKAVDDAVIVRAIATKFTVDKAESLGAPTLEADPADSDWTAEIKTGSEDSSMAIGKRELYPHPLAKQIKLSKKLVRISAIDVETLIRDRLAYKFAISEEKTFLTGHGSNQPLGVFTASSQGISTSRDVSTGNTSTSIQTDGLIEAKYKLKGQYWGKARWIFHRDALKQIAKLKDGDGQYIWQQGIQLGQPDRLLGLPHLMSEYAPNTFETTLYVGILGDFSFYWIADALDMTVQTLVELYATTNQNGYIGRLETDGMPVLEEAFARVKLA